jgi:hypothetical protein
VMPKDTQSDDADPGFCQFELPEAILHQQNMVV